MHILVVPSWYSTERLPQRGVFFRDQVQALHRHGVRVGLIHPELRRTVKIPLGSARHNFFRLSEQDDQGVPVLRSHGWGVPLLRRANPKLWRHQLWRLFRHYESRYGRPDLIHAHGAIWAGASVASVGAQGAPPYVLTEHSSAYTRGLIEGWQQPRVKHAFRQAKEVLAVSGALREQIAPYAGDKPVEVVPNLLDTEYFREPVSPRDLERLGF